jgi:hypothetical protein
MTLDELEAIQKRLDAAAPGPWVYADGVLAMGTGDTIVTPEYVDDGTFIANAPQDIADLLAAVRERDEWLGRFAHDSEAFTLGREAERAEVVAWLRTHTEYEALQWAADELIRGVVAPMPHDELRYRHDKMEQTLREIVRYTEEGGPWHDAWEAQEIREVVLKALGES